MENNKKDRQNFAVDILNQIRTKRRRNWCHRRVGVSVEVQCSIRELLSAYWILIKSKKPEIISFLLENCRDRIYAQATEILNQELGDKWIGLTYEEIRSKYNGCGYAEVYLSMSANYNEFSSSAKIPTMLKLAELDLQKGCYRNLSLN